MLGQKAQLPIAAQEDSLHLSDAAVSLYLAPSRETHGQVVLTVSALHNLKPRDGKKLDRLSLVGWIRERGHEKEVRSQEFRTSSSQLLFDSPIELAFTFDDKFEEMREDMFLSLSVFNRSSRIERAQLVGFVIAQCQVFQNNKEVQRFKLQLPSEAEHTDEMQELSRRTDDDAKTFLKTQFNN